MSHDTRVIAKIAQKYLASKQGNNGNITQHNSQTGRVRDGGQDIRNNGGMLRGRASTRLRGRGHEGSHHSHGALPPLTTQPQSTSQQGVQDHIERKADEAVRVANAVLTQINAVPTQINAVLTQMQQMDRAQQQMSDQMKEFQEKMQELVNVNAKQEGPVADDSASQLNRFSTPESTGAPQSGRYAFVPPSSSHQLLQSLPSCVLNFRQRLDDLPYELFPELIRRFDQVISEVVIQSNNQPPPPQRQQPNNQPPQQQQPNNQPPPPNNRTQSVGGQGLNEYNNYFSFVSPSLQRLAVPTNHGGQFNLSQNSDDVFNSAYQNMGLDGMLPLGDSSMSTSTSSRGSRSSDSSGSSRSSRSSDSLESYF
ncbi:MAG: hypothetical protein LBR91_03665 [Puniceicoccales bacterium]|jgi:hypothetical protein|nr:hypothetical protein [Puniceicoccales bacterium]